METTKARPTIGTMTKVDLPHVERFKDRHGKTRLYYRVKSIGGKRIPLRGPEGSKEFLDDYRAAAGGGKATTRTGSESLRRLVADYYTSAKYKTMSAVWRRARRRILDRFCEQHGDKRYAHLEPRHINKIRDAMADRPGAANNLLKALQVVFNHAVANGCVRHNPVTGVERLRPKNRDGFHAWTMEEVERYERRHPVGTMARLALALLLYTGQRRGDVVKMGRQHVSQGWLRVRQGKTGAALEIPIHNDLRALIDTTETGDLAFLVTSHGKPFSVNGFGNWFRKRCDEAGLPHCAAHGLRKACATRLADSGASAHEIMAITGHATLSEVQRYTRAAQQKLLARRAGERMAGQNGNKNSQTLERCSQTSKKTI